MSRGVILVNRWVLCVSLLFCFLSIICVDAKEGHSEDVLTLDEIVIKDRRIKEDQEPNISSYTTVIPGENFKDRFTTIPEVISESPGVTINRFGGLGDFSSVSIRGSDSDQVLVYLDGVLLNSAQGGGVNLGNISPSLIGKIRVYRGSSPLRFGASNIGGIIEIDTKMGNREGFFSIQTQYGSFETLGLNIFSSHKRGELDYLLGGDFLRSENNFEFFDNNGTQFNILDDTFQERKNNQYDAFNLLLKGGYDINRKTRVALSNNYFSSLKGVPGIANFQSLNANLRIRDNISALEFSKESFLFSNLNFLMNVNFRLKRQDFYDPQGEIGLGNTDNENLTGSMEVLLNLDFSLGRNQILRFVPKLRFENFSVLDNLREKEINASKRRHVFLGLGDTMVFFKDRFLINLVGRLDFVQSRFKGETLVDPDSVQETDEQYFTWQVGGKFQISKKVFLKGNVGKFLRIPSLFELFGNRGGFIGNANIKAEESLNRDIGIHFSDKTGKFLKRIILEVVYFEKDVDNLIQLVQNSQRTSIPMNISEANIWGMEFSSSFDLFNFLFVTGNYTFQEAIDRSDNPRRQGKFLPGRPEVEAHFRSEIYQTFGKVFYSFNFVDNNFLDPDNFLTAHPKPHNWDF